MTVKQFIEELEKYPSDALLLFKDVETNSSIDGLWLSGVYMMPVQKEEVATEVNILLTECEE